MGLRWCAPAAAVALVAGGPTAAAAEWRIPLRAVARGRLDVIHADSLGAIVAAARAVSPARKFWPLEAAAKVFTVNQYMLTMARVMIGTPPREFTVVVDTGSSALVVPSHGCVSPCVAVRHYAAAASRTGRAAGCGGCTCEQCGDVCEAQCLFGIMYADGAEASGGLFVDEVALGGTNLSAALTFLGFDSEHAFRNGHLTDDYLHGILGLGPGHDYCPPAVAPATGCVPMDFVAALTAPAGLPNMFAVRFGNGLDEDGALIIGGNGSTTGDLSDAEVQWAQLQGRSNYQVYLHGLSIQDTPVISEGAHVFGRTLVDSGTNMIILADAAYEELQAMYQRLYADLPAVATYKSFWNKTGCRSHSWTTHPHDDCKYCLFASKVDITQYPDLVFLLDDDVQLTIPASRYFYTAPSTTTSDLLYCLGVTSASHAGLPNRHTSVLGQVFLQSFLTIFDRDHQTIGFATLPQRAAPLAEAVTTGFAVAGAVALVLLVTVLLRRYSLHQQEFKERFELGLPTAAPAATRLP